MAKITLEKWQKKQAQTPDGWNYSVDCYGKDEVKKSIYTAENERIVCTVYFADEFDKKTFSYTGNNLIKINISLWRCNGEFWHSYGLGKTYTASEKFSRKAYKHLTAQAEQITDQMIIASAKENKELLLNACII